MKPKTIQGQHQAQMTELSLIVHCLLGDTLDHWHTHPAPRPEYHRLAPKALPPTRYKFFCSLVSCQDIDKAFVNRTGQISTPYGMLDHYTIEGTLGIEQEDIDWVLVGEESMKHSLGKSKGR